MQTKIMRLFAILTALLLASPAHATPKVQEIVTPGGLHALLVEAHDLPVVSLILTFTDSGAASDAPDKSGRAYMSGRMLLQGAGDLDADAFQRRLQERAITLTSAVDSDFFTLSLKTLTEQQDEAFRLLGLALTQPRFDTEAAERIRADALSDLARLEADGSYLSIRNWQTLAYPAHPYGQAKQGTKDTVAALSAEDYRFFTQHYLARDRMVIAAVGDITAEKLATLLDKHLSPLTAKATPEHPIGDASLPQPGAQRVRLHESPQTVVNFGLPALKRRDPEFYAAYLLNHILGGGTLTSRLSEELREKRGLVYYASSQSMITLHGDALQGSFATRNEQAKEAVRVFRDVLTQIGQHGVSAQELKQAKGYLTGSFALQLDNNTSMAQMLITMQVYHLGNDYMDKRNGYLEAVTLDQVNALAKRLIAPEHALISVVGKPAGLDAAP